MKYFANMVTASRMIMSVVIPFSVPLSSEFYLLYTFCGISDMIDGSIARFTHSESRAGALMDSIADIMFLLAAGIKLMPLLAAKVIRPVWFIVLLIAAIRISAYAAGFIRYHRFAALHTRFNKLTGALLFCLPYFILTAFFQLFCIVVCVTGICSAIEEFVILIKVKEYNPDIKGLLHNSDLNKMKPQKRNRH